MRGFLLVAGLIALLVAAWPPLATIEAALVLADIAAGPGGSPYKAVTSDPERRQVAFSVNGSRHEADLHFTSGTPRAALILVPGADRRGRDEPRLLALAETLARARFLVLVPEIPALKDLALSSEDQWPIRAAVRWLDERHQDLTIGIAAISYAAAPALLAALEEPEVSFLLAVGGVHDVTALVTFFTTGHFREHARAPWQHLEPNAFGKWAFVAANAGRMEDSADRALLAAIASRRMADLQAPVEDLVAGLTPQGRAVMALLDNGDPEAVPSLMAALPPALRDELGRLDLRSRDLERLRARLILVHGRDDRIVPWTESASLAGRAPHATLVLLDSLAHADLGPSGIRDSWALLKAVRLLLAERG